MLAVMTLFLVFLRTDKRVTLREGFALLSAYALYLAVLVALTLGQA